MPCGMPGSQQSSAASGHNSIWRPLVRCALKLILERCARYEWRPVVIPGGRGEKQRAMLNEEEPLVCPSCPRAWDTRMWSAKVRGRRRLALGRRPSAREPKGATNYAGANNVCGMVGNAVHKWSAGAVGTAGGGGEGGNGDAQIGYGEPSSAKEDIHASLQLNLRNRSASLLHGKMDALGVDTAACGYAERRPGAQRASSAFCIARTMWLPTWGCAVWEITVRISTIVAVALAENVAESARLRNANACHVPCHRRDAGYAAGWTDGGAEQRWDGNGCDHHSAPMGALGQRRSAWHIRAPIQ